MTKGKNRLEPYEKMLSKLIALTGGLIVLSAAVSGFDIKGYVEDLLAGGEEAPGQQEILEQVPEAGSSLYAEVNGGEPFFTRAEIAGARAAPGSCADWCRNGWKVPWRHSCCAVPGFRNG